MIFYVIIAGMLSFFTAYSNYELAYDEAYTKNEALITAISWTIWGGASAYLFRKNRVMALKYYTEENMETVDSLFSF